MPAAQKSASFTPLDQTSRKMKSAVKAMAAMRQ